MDMYAIYLRKSRADMEAEKLGEGETLARHRKILTELAARQGLYVAEIYQEIVSGETIEARPEIQRLIKDCYDGRYRGIIIIDVDRLSRGNQGDMQKIMDCLKFSNNGNGLLIVTPTKIYDVRNNSDDEEYMEFVLFMSRREYKTIQKRLERGRKQAVVEGNFMGSYRPYGYDIVKTKYGRTLKPNPDESRVVKWIYDWTINDNLTPGKIARKLDLLGVPTYTGSPEWNVATIKTILTNPTYKGKVRWNDRMTVKKMENGEVVKMRPRSNHTSQYMEYDGKHPAIISAKEFALASSRFTSDRTKSGVELQNMLAGLLVCEKCGRTIGYQSYATRKNTAPRYVHAPSKICKVKSALVSDVTAALIEALNAYIRDFQLKVDNSPAINKNSVESQIKELEEQRRKVERKLSKVFDDYENEIYTANEFVERKAKHNKDLENIKNSICELEDSIPEKTEYEEKIVQLKDAVDIIKNNEITAKAKNQFLKEVIESIKFSRENNSEFVLDLFLH